MSGTLGILGGMGPLATHALYGQVIAETPALRDQDHLHVIIDADPAIPDRTAFLAGKGPDPRPAIVAAGRRLMAAGADLLVMPCDTANSFLADIQAMVDVPVFDWIGAAVAAVQETGAGQVGILATDGMLATHRYQNALKSAGIEPVVPRVKHQAAVMRVIYEGVKAGRMSAVLERELIRWQLTWSQPVAPRCCSLVPSFRWRYPRTTRAGRCSLSTPHGWQPAGSWRSSYRRPSGINQASKS